MNNTTTGSGTTVALDIGGMTCASCAARITKRLNKIDGVDASVNYATEQATVTLPVGVSVDEVVAQVEAIGYTAKVPAAAQPDTADDEGGGETDPELTARLTVSRNGDVVTDLEPYLGASGHLVAMRSGDLAYAHVHPAENDEPAPGVVTFDAELTSAGRYGLFFDFKHNGTVHTAAFTFDQGPVTGTPEMEM